MTVGDVTSRVASCDERTNLLCFSNRSLTIAIPRRHLASNSSWTESGSSFEVIAYLEKVRLLGMDLDGLYVIEAQRDARPPVDLKRHRFRILFSYSQGLIAFGEIEEESETVLYFAERLPSVGAEKPDAATSP